MVQLGEHFASEGPGRESEWARQRRWFIKAKHDHQRREEMADKMDDAVSALSAAVTVASEIQVREFKVKLDTYDSATVEALMENQLLRDAVEQRIAALLDRAYVMEDGRRVFKTEDGSQVFDEHGTEVTSDELDFDLIGPDRPTNEEYRQEINELQRLEAQQTEILEFQEKVDAARERIDAEISEDDLAELDADLVEAMPDAVRAHAGIELRATAPALTAQIKTTTVAPTVQTQTADYSGTTPTPFQ
ncbi:hypothetical protein [Sulfitobacter pacificus]|uniref:hypothetical protein n=1 Tax=Sulfitobacter pacificus TaxID=1499314 RepID=UPI0031091BEE